MKDTLSVTVWLAQCARRLSDAGVDHNTAALLAQECLSSIPRDTKLVDVDPVKTAETRLVNPDNNEGSTPD